MGIFTKRGDKGRTDLIGKKNVKKKSEIVAAIGIVDELNCFVGWTGAASGTNVQLSLDEDAKKMSDKLEVLKKIQQVLFKIGTELAGGEGVDLAIETEWTEWLIEKLCAGREFGEFVRPGEKGEFSARLHLCRAACRRAERAVCRIRRCEPIVQFLNRLSDLFFAMAEC
jgi:cob(I)alamin adenosyltransferase